VSREYADPDCPDCGGLGFIYGESMLDGGHSCHCMMDALKLQNMEKTWVSLSEAKEIPRLRERPPLKKLVKHNLWITASDDLFRAHFKALAFSQTTMWDARVFSDKDLVSAWLKTAKAQGHKIYDSEIDNHEGKFVAMDIDELVEPFELVVLKLGVKQAPNKETPNVLLEAVAARVHLGKPTWIVDQPDQRIDFMHHRGYSEHLEGILNHWPHITFVGAGVKVLSGPEPERQKDVVYMDPGEVLEPTPEATAAIEEALSDLKPGDEGEEENEEDEGEEENEEDEGEEENEEDEGEEENEEDDDDEEDPMVAALRINEEKAAQKQRGKPRRKKPWKKRK